MADAGEGGMIVLHSAGRHGSRAPSSRSSISNAMAR
jgi:hypothetical protein